MTDKVDAAIKRLQEGAKISQDYYDAPLIICYSGGKDSEVILQLAKEADIDFIVTHNYTTVDAPETNQHVRRKFKQLEAEGIPCEIIYPTYKGSRINMWSLIPIKRMPPTRTVRYCCDILKETTGKNHVVVTGVRHSESIRRSGDVWLAPNIKDKNKRQEYQNDFEYDNKPNEVTLRYCLRRAKVQVKPILDWGNKDVWDYLRDRKIECNPLYQEGFCRIGCVGCPMARRKMRYEEFRRWPQFKKMYMSAFDRMLKKRKEDGLSTNDWESADDVWRWWMEEKNLDGQIEMTGFR